MAKVFAAQAKDAGVDVKVKVLDSAPSSATSTRSTRSRWTTGTRASTCRSSARAACPNAPFNETHWPPPDSNYLDLHQQALSATDEASRCAIVQQMYALEFEQGGYIIPFFRNLVDAYGDKVGGLTEGVGILNLDYFGRGFREVTVSG